MEGMDCFSGQSMEFRTVLTIVKNSFGHLVGGTRELFLRLSLAWLAGCVYCRFLLSFFQLFFLDQGVETWTNSDYMQFFTTKLLCALPT